MNKFRIACHIYIWEDLTNNVVEPVFRQVAEVGYEGVEGLSFQNAEDLVDTASAARAWGLQVVNARARTSSQSIRYNAVLGNKFAEIWSGPVEDLGPPSAPHEERFPVAADFYEPLISEAARYGIRLGQHIHLGQLVVTNHHVDLLSRHLPEMGILFDTGHLIAAGGDPIQVIRDHGERIVHVHIKDFHRASGWDPDDPDWNKSHFAPLGGGNSDLDVKAVLKGLEDIGYDGWVSVELDPQPPLMNKGIRPIEYMRKSREYLRSLGY